MSEQTPGPAASPTPSSQVIPPSHEMLPLITLAVEHVFDTLTREPVFTPTILAVAEDGSRGMWPLAELSPELAAEAVGAIQPRPALAVAVFDGETQTPEGPRPAVAVEAFEAGAPSSTRLVIEYVPGVPGTDLAARMAGEPQVVANGPNPLTGTA